MKRWMKNQYQNKCRWRTNIIKTSSYTNGLCWVPKKATITSYEHPFNVNWKEYYYVVNFNDQIINFHISIRIKNINVPNELHKKNCSLWETFHQFWSHSINFKATLPVVESHCLDNLNSKMMENQLAMAKFIFWKGNKSKIEANFGIKWYKKPIILTNHF